jgi:DNA polymerase-3 subunit epsilon
MKKFDVNRVTFFDTETTGVKYNQDKIVSVYCENKKKGWSMNVLSNPEMDIPEGASNVHGIYNEMLIDEPTNDVILDKLVNIFDDTLIIGGYNILKFDMPLVIHLCNSYNINIDYKKYEYLDVYFLLKVALNDEEINKIGSLRLGNVYKYVTGKELINAHDARMDIFATKRVYKWLNDNYDLDDCRLVNHEYLTGEPVSGDYKFLTGKRTGYTVNELLVHDKEYLTFMKNKNHLTFDSSITI